MTRLVKIKRPPSYVGNEIRIHLTNGYDAIIDIADAPLAEFNWVYKRGYAERAAGGRRFYLHREVAQRMGEVIEGKMVDHVDMNPLNNRRANLRAATRSQNGMNARLRRDNTSGNKGVSWYRPTSKWQAIVCVDGKNKLIGRFHNKHDAIAAHASAVANVHGEFGRPHG